MNTNDRITNWIWPFRKENFWNGWFQTVFLYERRYLRDNTLFQHSYSDTKLSVTFCISRYARRHIWIFIMCTANNRLYSWHSNLGVYTFDIILSACRMVNIKRWLQKQQTLLKGMCPKICRNWVLFIYLKIQTSLLYDYYLYINHTFLGFCISNWQSLVYRCMPQFFFLKSSIVFLRLYM